MSKRSGMMIVGVVVLLLASLACEFSASTANIGDAWLSDSQDGRNRITVFRPEDTFYALVDLRNAPDDTTLKAVWIALDVEGVDPNLVIDQVELTSGSNIITFTLSSQDRWPVGKYRVEIYLNGELDRTLDFEVR